MSSIFSILSILACSSTIYAMDSEIKNEKQTQSGVVSQKDFMDLVCGADHLGNLFGKSEEDYFSNTVCKKYGIEQTATASGEIKLKIQQSAELLLSIMENQYGKYFPRAFELKRGLSFSDSILSPENEEFRLIQKISDNNQILGLLKLVYLDKKVIKELEGIVGGGDLLEILLDSDHPMNKALNDKLDEITEFSIPEHKEESENEEESDEEGKEETFPQPQPKFSAEKGKIQAANALFQQYTKRTITWEKAFQDKYGATDEDSQGKFKESMDLVWNYTSLSAEDQNLVLSFLEKLSQKKQELFSEKTFLEETFLDLSGTNFEILKRILADKEAFSNLKSFLTLRKTSSGQTAHEVLSSKFYKQYGKNAYEVLLQTDRADPLYQTLLSDLKFAEKYPDIAIENIFSNFENYKSRALEIAIEWYSLKEEQIVKERQSDLSCEELIEFLKETLIPQNDDHTKTESRLLLIVGDGGTGKTHLSVALMKYLLSKGKKIAFAADKCDSMLGYTARELAPEGPYGWVEGCVSRGFLEKDCVVLDDLNIPTGSKKLLSPLIEKYHDLGNRTLIVTANTVGWENLLIQSLNSDTVYKRDEESWKKGIERWNTEIKEQETFKRFFGRFSVMFRKIIIKGTSKRLEDHRDPALERLKNRQQGLKPQSLSLDQGLKPEQKNTAHRRFSEFQQQWAEHEKKGEELLKKHQEDWARHKEKGGKILSTLQEEMEEILNPPEPQKKILPNSLVYKEVHDLLMDKPIEGLENKEKKNDPLKQDANLKQETNSSKAWSKCSIF